MKHFHFVQFDRSRIRLTILWKKHAVEKSGYFMAAERTELLITVEDEHGFKSYIYYTSYYFSIPKYSNDNKPPFLIKLPSIMSLKCARHPSGPGDNDAIRWQSKFWATVSESSSKNKRPFQRYHILFCKSILTQHLIVFGTKVSHEILH